MSKGRIFDIVIVAASLAVFGFFSLQQLELPGLYYDEAADAVPAMQLALGKEVELLNGTGLVIGNLKLPIMTMDYVGTVNTYLLVPLFSLLGVNVISLRLLTVIGSGLTIVFSYFLSKELLDRPVAALTVALLAVNPAFVFWSRQGIHVTSMMTVMSTGSLLCFLVWRRRRNPFPLYLAALLLGLGLSAKLLFLWFILALIACAVLLLAIPGVLSRLPLLRFRASAVIPKAAAESFPRKDGDAGEPSHHPVLPKEGFATTHSNRNEAPSSPGSVPLHRRLTLSSQRLALPVQRLALPVQRLALSFRVATRNLGQRGDSSHPCKDGFAAIQGDTTNEAVVGGGGGSRATNDENIPPADVLSPLPPSFYRKEERVKVRALWSILGVGDGKENDEDLSGPKRPARNRLNWLLVPVHATVFTTAFLLGAWMILLYNLQTMNTITILSKNLVTTSYGVNNFAFLDNLRTSLDAFRTYLRGETFWYLGALYANDWYPEALGISAAGILFLLVHPRARQRWRSLLFPLLMLAFIIVQSTITVSGLWATHYFIAFPFPQLIIAAFAVTMARLLPWKKVAAATAVVGIALLIAKDSYVNFRYHRVLAWTGGLFTHSEAIYPLAEFIESRGVAEPMAMDWGIKTSVQIITQGRVNPIEMFQYESQPGPVFYDWLYGSLTQRPDTLYVFHTEDAAIFPRYEAFISLAGKLEKRVQLEQTVRRKDSTPLFYVYSAR